MIHSFLSYKHSKYRGIVMIEKIYETRLGNIHYWINDNKSKLEYTLVFLPGLTADHRLFEQQLEYMKDKYQWVDI